MAKETYKRPVCSVVDQFCEAPANVLNGCRPLRISTCYKCGEEVCKKCSSRRLYQEVFRRLCNNCQIEIDDGDHVVMQRIRRMAEPRSGKTVVEVKKSRKRRKASQKNRRQKLIAALYEVRDQLRLIARGIEQQITILQDEAE